MKNITMELEEVREHSKQISIDLQEERERSAAYIEESQRSVTGTSTTLPRTSTLEEPYEPEMELPSSACSPGLKDRSPPTSPQVSLLSRVQRWNAEVRGAS